MMKKLLFFVLLLPAFCFSQSQVKLKLSNYSPRVGEKVEVRVEMGFLSDEIMKQLRQQVASLREKEFKSNESADFLKEIIFTDVGKFQLGPLKFQVNGTDYITNSLEIEVLPELPDEEGIWVRLVQTEDKTMVVLEQKVKSESKENVKNSGNEENSLTSALSATFSTADKFASIITYPGEGISFFCTQTSSSLSLEKFSSSKKVYVVKFGSDFDGSFTLTSKHFENLPKGAKVGKLDV